jgi:hypothetical protein
MPEPAFATPVLVPDDPSAGRSDALAIGTAFAGEPRPAETCDA